MPRIWIKIDGITNLHDARLAQAAGADALGLVLIPGHSHEISLDEAADIAAASTIQVVAVIHDATPDMLRGIGWALVPSLVEIQGQPPKPDDMVPAPWYRRFTLQGRETVQVLRNAHGDRFLLAVQEDQLPGGPRFRKEPSLLREAGSAGRMVLGGCIGPGNVDIAFRAVKPWGLDVMGSVEREAGVKDWTLMDGLIRRVRAIEG